MSVEWCKRCDGIMFTGPHSARHECPPMWLVWYPENGMDPEDGKLVRAPTAEQAAEQWASWYDSYGADYGIVGGTEAIVGVRKEGSDDVEWFAVSGRTEAVYDARTASPSESKADG